MVICSSCNVFISFAIIMGLDPKVWLPHFLFVMQTIAISYPAYPNDTSKKKYYDLIQNMALFLPDYPLGNEFLKLLDQFPLTPYLSSRLSFMKWTHFVRNKLNQLIKAPQVDFYDNLENYYDAYKPKEFVDRDTQKKRKKYIQFTVLLAFVIAIVYIYKK